MELSHLFECVPNFSEGRDQSIIQSIIDSIQSVKSVKLLNVDIGRDANRTVITMVGQAEALIEAGFNAYLNASKYIDMSLHQGAHPRIGAVDVFPWVALDNSNQRDANLLAHRLAKRVGEELSLPIYMYGFSATHKSRIHLSAIRKGEYEGLKMKMNDPNWLPDYGPSEFNPKFGASVMGARPILLAYNFNLNTRDKIIAQTIAEELRESGSNKFIHKSHGLKSVKALGWFMTEYNCAQVSCNLTDLSVTPLHLVWEKINQLAEKYGLRITGSELIGMIPKNSLLDTANYFSIDHELPKGEHALISDAIKILGLNSVKPFIPEERILEYKMGSMANEID